MDNPDTSSRSAPITEAVGDFLGRQAPDGSWFLRDDPWPAVGELVEVCFGRRARAGDIARPLNFGLASLVERDEDGLSEWRLPNGLTLLLAPDFWRPRQSSD